MKELFCVPRKQEAWYLQIKNDIARSKRPIDKMSLAEISKMFKEQKFVCDSCGKELRECNLTLYDHIMHLINPMNLLSCDACFYGDKGRITPIYEPDGTIVDGTD